MARFATLRRQTRPRIEPLEDRLVPAADVFAANDGLRVVLVSSDVPGAEQVAAAATPGTVAVTFDAASTDFAGIVGLLEALAADNGGTLAQLGLVAHGAPGQINLGTEALNADTTPDADP